MLSGGGYLVSDLLIQRGCLLREIQLTKGNITLCFVN